MIFIRPITHKDFKSLQSLAHAAKTGLTSLPKDKSLLQEKIGKSVEAFASTSQKKGESLYLFVMENPKKAEIIGVSGIISKRNPKTPFTSYTLEVQKQHCPILSIEREMRILKPKISTHQRSEICSLFLMPQHRKEGLGQLLSLSRFHFIASHMKRFESNIVAELRGVQDRNGNSPLWNSLGKHFVNLEFAEAEILYSNDMSFVQELMSKYPIYVDLLPKKAQEVIGKPHQDTLPAMRLLEKEGFCFENDVDPFDGGPFLRAFTKHIRSINKSRVLTVGKILVKAPSTKTYIISNLDVDFRACFSPIRISKNQSVTLSVDAAKTLRVNAGDQIRCIPAYT
ncbi:MAG: arginine N-succinyltransferase [Chlamydiales bacterium]|jgi:arginine N-succinyltransferase